MKEGGQISCVHYIREQSHHELHWTKGFHPRTSCEILNVSRYVSLHACETVLCWCFWDFDSVNMLLCVQSDEFNKMTAERESRHTLSQTHLVPAKQHSVHLR